MDLEKAYNKIDNLCCLNSAGNSNFFDAYKDTQDEDFCKDANEMVEALETIKGLVDLQKELGCPLEVYIKATIDGIKVDGSTYKVKMGKDNYGYYFSLSNGSCFPFYLTSYKKTWCLKEDKSK